LLLWQARQATAYMRGQRCSEEMRNSTRVWIRRDLSLPRDSWQPFIDWGTNDHSRVAVVAHSWRIVDHCQTIDVDRCRQNVKLQSVLRLCSGFYRSKDPTNSIKVLKEVQQFDLSVGTKLIYKKKLKQNVTAEKSVQLPTKLCLNKHIKHTQTCLSLASCNSFNSVQTWLFNLCIIWHFYIQPS